MLGEFVKTNYGHKYKTAQYFDIARRVYNNLTQGLGCLGEFDSFFGEYSDFQSPDLNTLTILLNIHALGKVVCNHLGQSYPTDVLKAVYIEGCKLLVPALAAEAIASYQLVASMLVDRKVEM